MNLKKEINKQSNKVILIISNSKNYNKLVSNLVKSLPRKVVYLSLNKPCDEISSKNFFFITPFQGNSKNCIHIENLSSLTELSILISNLVERQKFDAFVFDSISSLMTYHSTDLVRRFVRYLVSKLRSLNIQSILIIMDSESPSTINDLCQISNKCIVSNK